MVALTAAVAAAASIEPTPPSPGQPPLLGGLTTAEAQRLSAQVGANAMPSASPQVLRRALGKLWAPIPWMLEAAILIQVLSGKELEAAFITVLLLANAALSFIQEGRAQATLRALSARLAMTATCKRDGVWATLDATRLVPQDLVAVELGAVVPADLTILTGSVLADQSMLTGESQPLEVGVGATLFAGALIRRGQATAVVTATGTRTAYGRTAELVRDAQVVSTQQSAVIRMVRNLAIVNGGLIAGLIAYALIHAMPVHAVVPLVLTAVLASIPIGLPATFAVASAVGARVLARQGVLVTRLSAVDEAASIDILCADKTGTLTCNQLAITAIRPFHGCTASHVLAMALCASAEAGQDPVEVALRATTLPGPPETPLRTTSFTAFDPATKMSTAVAVDAQGRTLTVIKGAYAVVARLAPVTPEITQAVAALEAQGNRVLGIGAGPPGALVFLGLIALSDPPRADSRALIRQLDERGIRTVMLSGDAPATAAGVATAVGITGPVCPPRPLPAGLQPDTYGVYAGILPEDKFAIVTAFEGAGHKVGMCGDGANDAPALRQAHMGIAVATATDVAKAAAGIVLIAPGLTGIVVAVREGREIYQRILTYALNSMTKKMVQVLFLGLGLIMTGQAILTPLLMIIIMLAGDVLGMSLTTDHVQPSAKPNGWRIGALTGVAICMGACELVFCLAALAVGHYRMHLDPRHLQTLAFLVLVCANQATTYVLRARHGLWAAPHPSRLVLLSSGLDILLAAVLAGCGYLMAPLGLGCVLAVMVAAFFWAQLSDRVKIRALLHFPLN